MKLLSVGLLASVSAWAGGAGSFVPFLLYADFEEEPPEPMRASIQKEVEGIMSPTGWTFDWRPLRSGSGETCIRLAVIHFKGTCSAEQPSPFPRFPSILGTTFIEGGTILPFTDIYCNAIRDMLTPGLLSVDREPRDSSFGRAVGRVVAHELYHIFGNTQRHASKGLAKAEYSAVELLSDRFSFQVGEIRMLHTRAVAALLERKDWLGSFCKKGAAAAVIGRVRRGHLMASPG